MTVAAARELFAYRWLARPYRHTFRQMFRHAIDHSTYHRGQLVALLRQVGVTPPSTGLIVFYRERGAGATPK